MKSRNTIKVLSESELREIESLEQIVIDIAGYNIFEGIRMTTSSYVGEPFHWCLERIDVIIGAVEPMIRWTDGSRVSPRTRRGSLAK